MASITAWAKKVWKDRKTEYPTRRTLTKTDGSQEIVTVARNEGTVSQEGDAFSAQNMNDLEERIDAGFAAASNNLDSRINAIVRKDTNSTARTMTALFTNVSDGSIFLTNTELVSDKPAGKYGTILIIKYSSTRAGAICLCTDGTMYTNNWNASTSKVTGWIEK